MFFNNLQPIGVGAWWASNEAGEVFGRGFLAARLGGLFWVLKLAGLPGVRALQDCADMRGVFDCAIGLVLRKEASVR